MTFEYQSIARLLLCGVAAIHCLLESTPAETAQPARPNIVVIVADDLGFSDLGCYGGEIQTPNLDRLASGGLRYTQFYNAAKCHTTRAALMSGLYPHQTGCELPLVARQTKDASRRIQHSGVSIASVLRDAGYATFASGKWHAGGRPIDRGFDHFFGLPGGACSYFTPAKALQRDGERAQIDPEEPFYFTDAITDQAVQYVNGHLETEGSRPFFLYAAYTAPHWPMHAHEEDIARYRGVYSEGWHAIRRKRHQRLIEMGIVASEWKLPEIEPSLDWESVEHRPWHERRMEVYAAMVDRMDQGIGRIVASLREHDAIDNTVIIFLSDNGGSQEEVQANTSYMTAVMPECARDGTPIRGGNDPSIMPGPETTFQTVGHEWGNVSNTPFRYGQVRVHEGGIASPLIVHWPDGIHARGELRRQMTHVIDLLPTLAELANAKYPREYRGQTTEPPQGLSLVPTFADQPLAREALFFEMNGNRAIRKERWKAVAKEGLARDVRYRIRIPADEWELYDMRVDRTETRNVAADHPQVLRELIRQWEAWIENGEEPDPNSLTPEEEKRGFELLSNGRDFSGWNHPDSWTIEDGAFATKEPGGGLVYREKKIPDDFELRFQWKVASGSNSGVTCRPGLCEYQILDNAGSGDGKNPRTSAASLYFCMPPSHDATKPVGEWNSSRIVYKGTVLQHWLNGEKVIDFVYTDPRWVDNVALLQRREPTDLNARGAHLRLQNHGHPVWFRGIKLRSLDEKDQLDREPVTPADIPPEIREAEQRTAEWFAKKRLEKSQTPSN